MSSLSNWVIYKCYAFLWIVYGVSCYASRCNYWDFPWMIDGVSYHANGCECWAFPRMVDGVSYHADGCECWECISDMVVDVVLHGQM